MPASTGPNWTMATARPSAFAGTIAATVATSRDQNNPCAAAATTRLATATPKVGARAVANVARPSTSSTPVSSRRRPTRAASRRVSGRLATATVRAQAPTSVPTVAGVTRRDSPIGSSRLAGINSAVTVANAVPVSTRIDGQGSRGGALCVVVDVTLRTVKSDTGVRVKEL